MDWTSTLAALGAEDAARMGIGFLVVIATLGALVVIMKLVAALSARAARPARATAPAEAAPPDDGALVAVLTAAACAALDAPVRVRRYRAAGPVAAAPRWSESGRAAHFAAHQRPRR